MRFVKAIDTKIVSLPPQLVEKNVNNNILNKVRKTNQGKCNKDGYVLRINKIINRTDGKCDPDKLNGSTVYNVSFDIDLVHIENGSILYNARVTDIKNIGIFLETEKYIKIFIKADDLPDDFQETFSLNQLFNICAIKTQNQLGKTHILVVGKIHWYKIYPKSELLIKLPNISSETPLNFDVKFEENKFEPLHELGYNNSIMKIKRKINIVNNPIWNQYRTLLNPFELVYFSKNYYEPKKYMKNIPSRTYFKLWEIVHSIQIPQFINNPARPDASMNFLLLCEAPGGFIKAINDTRNKYKKDKYTVYTLAENNKDTIEISDSIKKELQSQIQINENNKSGDIRDYTSFSNVLKVNKAKYDVITADGGWYTKYKMYNQEKELFKLKLCEVIWAISFQKENGSFIWKVFDTFTDISKEIIQLISIMYENVYMFKPYISRTSNSEKYIVATNFKMNDKTKEIIRVLQNAWKDMEKQNINSISSLIELPKNDVTKNWLTMFATYNNKILLHQYEKIDEILNIIEINNNNEISENLKQKYIEHQTKIAKNWIESHRFLPENV